MKIFQELDKNSGNDYSIEQDENSDVGKDEFVHSETLEYVDKNETGAEGETGANDETGADVDSRADDDELLEDKTDFENNFAVSQNFVVPDKNFGDANMNAYNANDAFSTLNEQVFQNIKQSNGVKPGFENNFAVSQNFVVPDKNFGDANMNAYNANDAFSTLNEQVYQNIKQSNGVKPGFENNFAVSQNLFDNTESFGDANINADIANDAFSTFNPQVFQNNHPNENMIRHVKSSNGFNWVGPIKPIGLI